MPSVCGLLDKAVQSRYITSSNDIFVMRHNMPSQSVTPEIRSRAERIVTLFPEIMNSMALSKIHTGRRHGVGLTFNQYQALVVIREFRVCSVSELARKLKIAQSTASELVDRLVEARLVHREEQAGDRRRMAVRVSRAGLNIMQKRTKSIQKSYERVLALLSEEDQELFEEAFEKLHRVAVTLESKLKQMGE